MNLIHRLAAALVAPRTFKRLAFLLSAIPLGVASLAVLTVGWALGLGLVITLLGVPVLLGLAYACRGLAAAERGIVRSLLGVRVPAGRRAAWSGGLVRRLATWLRDPRTWAEQSYLLLRFLIGVPSAVAAVVPIGVAIALIAAPTYYWTGNGLEWGFWTVDTAGEAVLLVPLGLVVLLACPPIIAALAHPWRGMAPGLLAGDDPAAPPLASPAVEAASRRAASRRGLRVHAMVAAGINLLMIAIWAGSTPGGYFWPIWTILGLGLPLGVHAVVALTSGRPGPAARRALTMHAGIAGVLTLFLVLIWAVTTPGAYFWPMWTILALAGTVGIHALVTRDRGRARLEERIDVLTATRAGAVDAQAAELRRIERDLHDGAQARLVALAMDLGMAREKLDSEPEAAGALVSEAHEEAKRALVELRSLARGIHPAVLTDRGLGPALEGLAGRSRLPVDLAVSTGGRLPAAIEAAAYFVVAEGLTNAVKHGGATRARVVVARQDAVLRVSVVDDGVGGADPEGGGLTGLRRRVDALDGRFALSSPEGDGTSLAVELPCGS